MDSKNNPPSAKGGTEDCLHTTESKAEEILTVLWHQIPEWLQDNHYIQSGYRPPSNSYQRSAASITYLHNESVNIWTHFLGAIAAALTAAFMYFSIRPRYDQATDEDVLVFSCFFLGAVACLGMSATYHTISNHSDAVAKFGNRLDYIGIVFLIWGSFIPSIYYGFGAEKGLVRVYWSMVRLQDFHCPCIVDEGPSRSPQSGLAHSQ